MLSPQEIQNQKFEKAVFGGYDMSQVDEFLDKLVDDYGNIYKENVTLKGKMKVLVDKLEEYRSVDDEIRSMLYSTRRKSQEMLVEAQKHAESVVNTAKKEAEREILDLRTMCMAEHDRLMSMKAETAKYSEQIKEFLRKNIEIIDTYIEKAPEKKNIPPQGGEYKKVSQDSFEFTLPKDFIVEREEAPAPQVEPQVERPVDRPIEKPIERPIERPVETAEVREDEEITRQFTPVQEKMAAHGVADSKAQEQTPEQPVFKEVSLNLGGGRVTPMVEDDEDTGKIYGTPFTPKPTFSFNDLQFGANYEDEKPNKKYKQ